MNTMAIVSLSAAINQSVPDAVLEAKERAEREAMGRNDLQSWIAQNVYTNNRQLHPNGPRRTWRGASLLMSDRMMGVRDGLGLALTYFCQHRLDSVHSILVRLQVETEDRDEEDDVDGWVSPSEAEAFETSVPDDPMGDELDEGEGALCTASPERCSERRPYFSLITALLLARYRKIAP